MQLEDWDESAKKAKAPHTKPAPTELDLLTDLAYRVQHISEDMEEANASLKEIARATWRARSHLFWIALPIYISVLIILFGLILGLMGYLSSR
jgi:hypothetical protein